MLFREIRAVYDAYGIHSVVIAASIKNIREAIDAVIAGCGLACAYVSGVPAAILSPAYGESELKSSQRTISGSINKTEGKRMLNPPAFDIASLGILVLDVFWQKNR